MAQDVKILITAQDKTAAAFKEASANINALKDKASGLSGMLGSIGAGVSLAGVVAITQSIIDAADSMNDLSQRVGITVADLGKYQLATSQSGTSMEALAKGIKGLSVNMVEHSDALKAAGLNATTADEAMIELADLFQSMPDGIQKTALATKLFGKAGVELIPMLNLGSKGLQDAAEKSAKFAEQMAIMAPLADAFNDNLSEIAMYSKVSGMTMANELLPALLNITKAMADASQKGGVFNGVMAGLGAGIDNYWANVGNVYKSIGLVTSAGPGSRVASGQIATISDTDVNSQSAARVARQSGTSTQIFPDWVLEYQRILKAIGSDSSATKGPQQSAADKYMESLQKQLEKAQELNTVQTLGMEINAGRLGKITVSEQQRLVAAALLVDKTKAGTEAQKEYTKIYEESQRQSDAYVKSLLSESTTLSDANTALALHIAEIGLTKEAVNALQLSRIDDAIATQQQAAAQLEGVSGEEDEIERIKRQITLLKEKRALTAKGQIAQANADTAKEQDDASKKFAEELHNDVKGALSSALRDTKDPIAAFGDALGNVIFTRMTNALADSMIDGLFGNSKSGSGGLFSGIGALLGFDGGGYTGSGARSGGLDGKGGFMALLHPQETVVDHTRGQTAGGAVNISISANVGDIASKSDVVAGMRATASQIAAQIQRSRSYGGALV